jgi:hypothetical protein
VTKAVVDPNDVKVIDLGNGTVDVTVPANASGNVTIKVGNNTYNATIINGTAYVNVDNETPGEHNVTVIYSGDATHDNVTLNASAVIPKRLAPMGIEVNETTVGASTRVIVTIPDEVKGNVTVEVDGVEYSSNVTDGKAVFDIAVGTAGLKTIVATYAGDDWYVGNSTKSRFNVNKSSDFSINASAAPIEVGENAVINVTGPGDFNGTVTVNVGGNNYSVTLTNGTGQLEVSGLGNGTHNITLITTPTDKYDSITNASATIVVSKVDNAKVNASVANATYGNPVVVNVTVPADATGNVTIVIGNSTDNITVTVPITGGENEIAVDGVPVGEHNVTITYNGDDKYDPVTVTDKVNVTRAEINPDDVKLIDNGNGTVTVIIPGNATGNVTIKDENNNTYNATVVNGTAIVNIANMTPGTHNVTVIYSGDGNNSAIEVNRTITVPKYLTPITIEVNDTVVGNATKVIVTVPGDVKDNVTIEIDGTKYSKAVDANGQAVFDVVINTAGPKSVTATYAGDDWYEFNSTTAQFNATKSSSFSINASADPIKVGENAVINITGPSDFNGTVTVSVGGNNYSVSVTNGTGQLEVSGLGNGTHNITVTTVANDKYDSVTSDPTTVVVSKVENANVNATVENITVGEPAVVKVTVPDDATGNVTITIGDINKTVPIAGGENEIIITDVPVGEHNVTVTYNGDDKYDPVTVTDKINVTKAEINPDDIGLTDNGNGTITITIPGNASGNVTVKIGNETYNATVTNGKAIVNITNATPGTHNVTVIYSGDGNNSGVEVNRTLTVPKLATPITISVSDAMVGDIVKVTVTVPEDVKDNVTVEIDGKFYSMKPTNGKAVFNVENLLAGDKTITATYDGDSKYLFNSTTADFKVSKYNAPISVTVDNSTAGEATVKVTLPSDATGYVIVNVNGVDYGINLTNTKSVTVPIKTSGQYTAEVTYLGDAKYLGNTTSKKFTAKGSAPTPTPTGDVSVEVNDTLSGKDVVVKVTVPEGATGNVTVKVDGKTKVVTGVTPGDNYIKVPGVSDGNHKVDVIYSGDATHKAKTTSKTIKVFHSIIAEKSITRGWNSPYDYKAEFLDKQGHVLANTNVKFTVKGKTYTVKTDSQGIAYLKAKLPVGKYSVTIYNPVTGEKASAKTTIVKRITENKDIKLDFYDGTNYVVRVIGDNGKPVGAGEVVKISVNRVNYARVTDSKGYAKLTINLNPKTYKITTLYHNYKVSNKVVVKQTLKLVKKSITVKKSAKSFKIKATLKWNKNKKTDCR